VDPPVAEATPEILSDAFRLARIASHERQLGSARREDLSGREAQPGRRPRDHDMTVSQIRGHRVPMVTRQPVTEAREAEHARHNQLIGQHGAPVGTRRIETVLERPLHAGHGALANTIHHSRKQLHQAG
jgi:hypothetical protein